MAFQLINDMGSLMGSSDTALGLRAKFPFENAPNSNGCFIALNGEKISDDDFARLCAEEAANA